MRLLCLKADAPGVGAIYRLIDECSRFPGDPGHYGHIALQFSDGSVLTSHAERGVVIDALDYPPDAWDAFEFQADEAAIRAWAAPELGAPYDYAGVIRFLVPLIHQDPNRWFCSEICCAALQQVGLFADVEAWRVSPNKLAKMLFDAGLRPRPLGCIPLVFSS